MLGSKPPIVIGRFAPSPTGPLHLGSLYTAIGSFLDAHSKQGRWLLRIDDLDTPRNIQGADSLILKTLEVYGLHWDGQVRYQSRHINDYTEALEQLINKRLVYRCYCSRKSSGSIYNGRCLQLVDNTINTPYSLRVKTDHRNLSFDDRLNGHLCHQLDLQHGDFILKRRDGIIAYQFAVVIDDYLQQVNEVVRGTDLLDITPRQIYLQQLLELPTPSYMHLPIIANNDGTKLSKQTKAKAVDLTRPTESIFFLLALLNQNPPVEIKDAKVSEQLNWAISHWQPTALAGIQTISLH